MRINGEFKFISKLMMIFMATIIVCYVGLYGFDVSFASIDVEFVDDVSKLIQDNYIEDVSDYDLEKAAINGMLSSLDPYSRYYNPDEYALELDSSSGKFVGVGISMKMDTLTGYIFIEQVYEDTPASKAGLKYGDLITHVDGKDIKGMDIEKAAFAIRGEIGQHVVFKVLREGTKKPITMDLVREIVEISSVKTVFFEDENIIYFYIKDFNDGVANSFKNEYDDMLKKHPQVKGLIVDLRGNPGGYIKEAVELADMFLPKGSPIYHCVYKNGESDSEYAKKKPVWMGKMALLINSDSASASELFTGALQDAGVARVLGTKSFGKGIMQGTLEYDDGSAVELTMAEYVTGKRHKVHKVGITPDEIVFEDRLIEKKDNAPINEKKTYKVGEIGLNVYGVQQRLKDLGYDVDNNGIYDEKTRLALEKFSNKFEVDEINESVDGSSMKIKFDLTPKICHNIDKFLVEEIENPRDNQLDKAIEWIVKSK